MTTLYLLSGIPGSGKTTLAHELAQRYNAKVHSYDDVPNARQNPDEDGKIRGQWVEAMNADLLAGYNVVCDSTSLTSDSRKWITERLVPCRKVLIVKVVPLETCLQRNAQRKARLPDFVLEMAARAMEAPSPDEGWDEILVSKD